MRGMGLDLRQPFQQFVIRIHLAFTGSNIIFG
jgi:hypothetical protein